MAEAAGLPEFLTTREVAALLRVKERRVYELAGAGDIPCRRVTGKLLFPRGEIEAWIAGAIPREPLPPILSERAGHAAAGPGAAGLPAVVAGSHDPLLDWALRASGSGLASFFDGSLDGLTRLVEGRAIAAGLHLFEAAGEGWNVAQVEAAAPGARLVLVEWARRRQGLIVAPALAAEIRAMADLAGRRVACRQPSAGGARLFAHLLEVAGLAPDAIERLPEPARTETEAAAAVASGAADAAPGLEAAARSFGLAFVPTVMERFDLLIDRHAYFEPAVQTLLAFARGPAFAAKAQ
ncbi:MAG: helix-turn-helix transcriptional regulator, partial [Pseudomonadota bacterium]